LLKIIKKLMKSTWKDNTIIIVTNEISILKDCSKILVLDDGKIIDIGKHNDLVRRNRLYKRLCELE